MMPNFLLLLRLFKAFGFLRQILTVLVAIVLLASILRMAAIPFFVFFFWCYNFILLRVYQFTKFRTINYFLRPSNDHLARSYLPLLSLRFMRLKRYLVRFYDPRYVLSIIVYHLLMLTSSSSRVHDIFILLIPSWFFTFEAFWRITTTARRKAKLITLSLCKPV